MSDNTQSPTEGDLVYMVAGDDQIGDHHIFVTTNKGRAEARYQVMLKDFARVKANWLDPS